MKDIYMLFIIISGSALICVWMDRITTVETEAYKPLNIPEEYKHTDTIYQITIKGVTLKITKKNFETLGKKGLFHDNWKIVQDIDDRLRIPNDSAIYLSQKTKYP
jgi:hypothetical protein